MPVKTQGGWRSAGELGTWADSQEPTPWDNLEIRNLMFDDSDIPVRLTDTSVPGRTRNASSMSREEGGFGREDNVTEAHAKREKNLKRMRDAATARRRAQGVPERGPRGPYRKQV